MSRLVKGEAGRIVLEKGGECSGIALTGEFPKVDYELSLEAMRVEGDGAFALVTFPFDATHAQLAVGTPPGEGVSLGSVDGGSAMASYPFKPGTWHRLRLRVAKARITFSVDDKAVLDVPTAGRTLPLLPSGEPLKPFGIGTWQTTGALRNIRVRRLGD